MVLSHDNCLNACSSPGVRLGFGFLTESLRGLISLFLGRFVKSRRAGLVNSSLISREMDVALFLHPNQSFSLAVIYVLEAHSSRKEIKIF